MKTAIILLLWACCLPARAQKFRLFHTDTAMAYQKGMTHFLTSLEHIHSENNDKPIQVTNLHAEISHYLIDRLATGVGLSAAIMRGDRFVFFQPLESNTVGLGASGHMRYEIASFSHHNFYIETAYGIMLTADKFPAGGTHFNFTVRYGLGYNVRLRSGQFLFFGWRWMHLSNGQGFVESNPAYDGNGIYLGFKFARARL